MKVTTFSSIITKRDYGYIVRSEWRDRSAKLEPILERLRYAQAWHTKKVKVLIV